MPRKPKRQLSKPQALTFSPFARSVARVASAYNIKRQTNDPRVSKKSSPKSTDRALPGKSEQLESSDDEEFEGEVQADFAFFDPKPDDFHGVKVLLQNYLDDKQWDLSGFVDLILGQPTVGTVVKIEGDEDNVIYAVVTALNLGRYKDHNCIRQFNDFLLQVCPEKDVLNKLRSILGEKPQDLGLLVSQRVVNLPPQLLPPLYDALFDEVSWATEDEPTEELRKSFGFKIYLLVSKIYKHKNTGQKGGPSSSSDEAIIYIKSEDEIFHKLRNYRLMGLVMVVEADKVFTFRRQLQTLINE